MKCLKCNNKHDGSFGSGRYCSRRCANSRVRSDELKARVSATLKGRRPWNTGRTLSDDHKAKISKSGRECDKLSDDVVFVENSSYPRKDIKKRILQQKLIEYKCSECSIIGWWNNKELVLQLDHINGVNNDHRFENLRFLCPNCHTQQCTYAAKNRRNEKRHPK